MVYYNRLQSIDTPNSLVSTKVWILEIYQPHTIYRATLGETLFYCTDNAELKLISVAFSKMLHKKE